eukprot:g428.t1
MEASDADAVARDREKHPQCSYSTQRSSSCSVVNGSRSCREILKVLRHCPGERPVAIVDSTSTTEDENGTADRGAGHGSNEAWQRGAGSFGGRQSEELEGMAGSMMREVDGVLRMMESIGRMFGGGSQGGWHGQTDQHEGRHGGMRFPHARPYQPPSAPHTMPHGSDPWSRGKPDSDADEKYREYIREAKSA